jgi:4-amino-4-deoxy-L-arabinose transferase-like glycosyltransferase
MTDLPPVGMTPAVEVTPADPIEALDRSSSDWYLILIVALITVMAGAAVFYLVAFATVDPSAVEWFKGIGLTGFGALLGLLTQKAVSVMKKEN